MRSQNNIRTFFLHLLVVAALAAFSTPIIAQSGRDGGNATTPTENDTEKILKLFEQKRFAEAVPYLERMVKDDPNDSDLRFLYGFSLFMKAATVSDKGDAKKLLAQARVQFIKAKELGSKEETLDKLIAMIPADGGESSSDGGGNTTSQTFSKNKDAEEYMGKGEAYFARGDYDNAFEMYQKALKKDPNLYEAALWSGDVFLQKGDFDKAETWYQKAIVINPNRETAYRYSATPLMKQKKYDDARLRYVEAYITEPYDSRALGGLKQWSGVTGIEVGHPLIDVPVNISTNTKGDVNLTLAMDDKSDNGEFAWTVYGLRRAAWQSNKDGLSQNFKNAYPNETKYRHSLAEEFDALTSTVTALKEMMSNPKYKDKKVDPQLKTLIKLYDEGLLESYILLAMKDDEIRRDHAEYLKQNRAKLRQYVIGYVFGKPTADTQKADG